MQKLEIYGPIFSGKSLGEAYIPSCFAGDLAESIRNAEGDLTITVNSPGGEIEGMMELVAALNDYAKANPDGELTIRVESLAASAAAYLLLMLPEQATVEAFPTSMLMYHGASTCVQGGKGAMEDAHRYLDSIDKSFREALMSTGLTEDEINECLQDGRQLWLNGKEAWTYGIIDRLTSGQPTEIEQFEATAFRAVALFNYPTEKKENNMKKASKAKAEIEEEKVIEEVKEEVKEEAPAVPAAEELKEEIKEEIKEEVLEQPSENSEVKADCGEEKAKADLEELVLDLEKRIKFLEDKLVEQEAKTKSAEEKVNALSGGLKASAFIKKQEPAEAGDFKTAFHAFAQKHPEMTTEEAFIAAAKAYPELYKATIYERKYN